MSLQLVHLHFGAGRLGLGLIAPWFQTPTTKLFLFNRAVSSANPTGSTALEPSQRNELLQEHPDRFYLIQKPGESDSESATTVPYEKFIAYQEDSLPGEVEVIADAHLGPQTSVVVTASVLMAENYRSVIEALNVLSRRKAADPDSMGKIFLVACENTLGAREVFEHEVTQHLITPETRQFVVPVHALVDRMCVGLEADDSGEHPAVVVRAEDYGALKLELHEEAEELVELCEGSRVEFSRHLDVEKQIKSWQLNGCHWLIALHALQTHEGEEDFTLNQFLSASPENRRFAEQVMQEMSEGIAILLRRDPAYADFVRDVDVEAYLAKTGSAILERFASTDDPMTRILARFHTPTPDEVHSIESFSKRFSDRVDGPLHAYEAEKGQMPPAATRSILDLYHLIADGFFVERLQPQGAAA
ncbi:MAG TPA: hypothetical protein VF627_13680 [Abditibacterium sp.]|jgi:mannitol-1-phosphate/altronate dehydrogenase